MMRELAGYPLNRATSHFNFGNDNTFDKSCQRKNQTDFFFASLIFLM